MLLCCLPTACLHQVWRFLAAQEGSSSALNRSVQLTKHRRLLVWLPPAQRIGEQQLNEQFSRPQPRVRPVQRVTQADLAAPRAAQRPAAPEPLEALEPRELERSGSDRASR